MHRASFLSQPIRRQQRLFTGSLFPEEINDELYSFAQRHGLKSHVWIPRRAFEVVLKPYGIFILPSAALCDISPTFQAFHADMSQTMGGDRVLVNADLTSNPTFLEYFHEYIIPSLKPGEGAGPDLLRGVVIPHFWPRRDHAKGSDSPGRTHTQHDLRSPNEANISGLSQSIPSCFTHPLTTTGVPILKESVARKLLQIQSKEGYRMNYWLGFVKNFKAKMYRNVEETPHPGRYNPTWCVLYKPYTRTNQLFPKAIRRLMVQRAVEYGYVSRLWVTLKEAEELYHTGLLPERAEDSPPIFCNTFSGGIESVQFYCADQFRNGDRLFCNYREVNLLASGVRMPQCKLSGFPLLSQLTSGAVPVEDPDRDASKSPSLTSALRGEPNGIEATMQDPERYMKFAIATAAYDNIRLFGFTSKEIERKYLLQSDYRAKLRKQCILHGFPTPHFIDTKAMHNYGLSPASQELGVISIDAPLCLWGSFTWLQHASWFNIAQLAEPLVALVLFYKHPTHFFTGEHLGKAISTQCARLQVLHQYQSHEWVPQHILYKLGWKVQQGAPGVSHKLNSMSFNSPCYDFKVTDPFFNLDEVLVSKETKGQLRNYRPIDKKGRLFGGTLQMLLKLRAYERGYRSAVWVVIRPFFGYRLKDTITPVLGEVRQPLSGKAFFEAPMVRSGQYFLANEEDAESCAPGESSTVPKGVSAQYNCEDNFLILLNGEFKSEPISEHGESPTECVKASDHESEWGKIDNKGGGGL